MRAFKRKSLAYIQLCKVKVAFFSAFAAATGALLSSLSPGPQMSILAASVFFLACGASALNQYQEREIDILMPRTRNRPLPSGRLKPADALHFSAALISTGLLALLLAGGILPALLGAFAVIWYNGVYTHLKRRTAFAVIPGALVGALPVAIGWASGGGIISDPKLSVLCFFFFMWQVPHSWLLVLNHGEEYDKAGLPSLTALFSKAQLSRINFIWITSASVSSIFITISGAVRNAAVNYLLLATSGWLVWNGMKILAKAGRPVYSSVFNKINVFMLIVMSLLSVDKLFS